MIISVIEHFLICILATCTSSLEKCVVRSFAHFLIVLFVFGVELYKFLINFEYQAIIRCMGEYVLPISGLSFHFC